MATTGFCDGDYLGAYERFLKVFVDNISKDDQLPVKTSSRDVRDCELVGEIASIALQHLNQKICPPSLQPYLVKMVIHEFKILFEKQPQECGYNPVGKCFAPLKLMQTVTNKVNEICQRYLDNSRLALLPPPPSIPFPLVSFYAIKNKRRTMEDRSTIIHDLNTMFNIQDDAIVNYYAVFDGHGGQEAATYCAAHLHQYLVESLHYPLEPKLALIDAFKTTNSRFLECDKKNSGSTAVCALLDDKTLYIAWAGDSEAILARNGEYFDITKPHRPDRLDEKKRIESLGGKICYFGSWRVNGVLNVSRSIGDGLYKPFVSEVPEIQEITLDGTEDFLIIGCDGVWENLSHIQVVHFIYLCVKIKNIDPQETSVKLVEHAKNSSSLDNISAIVVFLTPPGKIAKKRLLFAESMYKMDYNGQQEELDLDNLGREFGLAPKYQVKPLRYDDNDDEDLGPETNVDANDDACEAYERLERENAMMQAIIDIKKPAPSELIPEADNVADSEDSDDEWNYYRPGEASRKAGPGEAEAVPSIVTGNGADKDPALVEKPDRCEGDKEALSPEPRANDDDSPSPQPERERRASKSAPVAAGEDEEEELEAEDVTAEYDELHEAEETKEPSEPLLELKENDTEAEVDAITKEDLSLDLYRQKLESLREPEDNKLEEPELLFHSKENEDPTDDMEYHLNPEAAEFVPTANSPTGLPQYIMNSDLIAGSPLKQSIRALKNKNIPSEDEFKKEIAHRPSEIDDSFSDYSNGEASPQKNALGDCEKDNAKLALNSMNLDESEISSTKAEYGDESTSNFSLASDFYRTGLSGVDSSYTSERSDFDAMATSMTPGDFKKAFDHDLDLNKVHELRDEDLADLGTQNGTVNEDDNDKKMMVDEGELMNDIEDGIVKNKFDLNLDELVPQQQQNAELFSSIVEERESDNKDLFMNKLNVEHGFELQNNDKQDENDFIQMTSDYANVNNSTQNAEFGEFSSDVVSTYAKNNPFASDYQATAAVNPDDSLQDLGNHMKNLVLNDSENKQDLLFDNHSDLLTPEGESKEQFSERTGSQVEVMQNPLDLNFGGASAEQKSDEPVIVSPTKEPEVMASKFEEENLMSQTVDTDLDFKLNQDLAQEFCFKSSHIAEFNSETELLPPNKEQSLVEENINVRVSLVQDFTLEKESSPVEDIKSSVSPVEELTSTLSSSVEFLKRKSINISESLQELNELEDKLNLKTHEVKDNVCIPPTQILKENLVDEQKDVEEIATPSATETKLEKISALSNESGLPTNEPPTEVASPTTLKSTETVAPVETTATVVAAAVEVAATVGTAATTKPTTKTDTSKISSKLVPTSKSAIKSALSTSPTKITPANKTSTTTKKPVTGLTAKAKTTMGTAAKPASNTNNLHKTNTATAKTSSTLKANVAPKTTTRTISATTTLKAKTSSSLTAKTNSTTVEKKLLANGTTKPISKPTTANSTASKTGPIKTTTSRLSIGPTATTAAKPRPTSAATTKTASKTSTTGISSSTHSTAARPKTAPVLNTTSKSKVGAGAMSPIIDKQIKETANKQISSARNAISTVSKTRLSSVTPTSNTSSPATKRISLVQKQSLAAAASPTKKPAPITKPGSKTNTASKVNSKVTSTTKNGTTASAKVIQNGVCETQQIKINTTATTRTTSNIEEDIPKKDVSPIEPITDNQLITAE